jgi:hypothetical protein
MTSKRRPPLTAIAREDLSAVPPDTLADLLFELVSILPYHEQKRWARECLGVTKPSTRGARRPSAPARLLAEVQAFCAESRGGSYVTWQHYDDRWGGGSDDGEGEEWAALFADLANKAIGMVRDTSSPDVATAIRLLFDLLHDAGETTDILGDAGAPEDLVETDLAALLEAYARSLLAATGGNLDEVIAQAAPIARRHSWAGGYAALARALGDAGRAKLAGMLERAASARKDAAAPFSFPPEAAGLVDLANLEGDRKKALAIKERFASQNAIYLQEVLDHYRKQRDWPAVVRLAELGIKRFANHDTCTDRLIEAKEALGDADAAQRAEIQRFQETGTAGAFLAVKTRAARLGNWPAVFEGLVRGVSKARDTWDEGSVRVRLLLAEGREREAFEEAGRGRRQDFATSKLAAKHALGRLCADRDLARFPKLLALARRLKGEKSEQYEWLRIFAERPATLSREEYLANACRLYRSLVDLHLGASSSSAAARAAYYAAIVFELSGLVGEPAAWADLLAYMKEKHGRKRLIWGELRKAKCAV